MSAMFQRAGLIVGESRSVFFDENCVLLANLLSMVEDSICKSDEPT